MNNPFALMDLQKKMIEQMYAPYTAWWDAIVASMFNQPH